MSKGTRIHPVRIPEDLLALAIATINHRGIGKDGKRWSLSDFVRVAMVEKIKKMNRSRRWDIQPADVTKRVNEFLQKVMFDEEASIQPPIPTGSEPKLTIQENSNVE